MPPLRPASALDILEYPELPFPVRATLIAPPAMSDVASLVPTDEQGKQCEVRKPGSPIEARMAWGILARS